MTVLLHHLGLAADQIERFACYFFNQGGPYLVGLIVRV